MQRRHRPFAIAGAVVLGVLAAALIFLLLFDLKSFAERRATAALGRPVTIGALELKIFPLEFVLGDLLVADVPAGQPAPANKAPFMKAEYADAVVGFWRLLTGDILFKRLTVENAVARIERRADGSLSWDVQGGDKAEIADKARLPEIRDLALKNVQMLYRDESTATQMTLNLNTSESKAGEPTLVVKGEGKYAGQPSTLNATGGSILALRDEAKPYPIDGTLVSGPTTVTVKGTVIDPINITGLNVTLHVKGQDAADLYRVAGVALPPTPPYTIDSHVDRDGDRWIFKNLKWLMGKSDFAGELVWDVSGDKPMLTGALKAQQVALKDLGGFIGAAPGEAETPTAQKVAAADREKERRADMPTAPEEKTVANELVIPDRLIDAQKLDAMNAKVTLDAAKIVDAGLPLDSFKVEVALKDGILKLNPLVFGVNQGKISIDLTVDSRAQPMKADAVATVQSYPLSRLVGKTGGENTSWGAIGGKIELHGTGNSLHRILSTANGDVGLAVGGGQISLFVVELMGIDVAELLGILLSKDKPTDIRCMVADFGIEQGKMTARTVVADTNDTIFRGSGIIDLGREVLDMRVHAKPKDVSPVTLRSKLLLTGTFAHPSFGPDPKNIILKGGIAGALGVLLTPLASLIALIDTGGGKDANCEALIAAVEQK